MEQQQPKAKAAATFATPLTSNDTPWPNTVAASTNLFVARSSWLILPNVNEIPTPNFIKMEKSQEKAPPKQAAIPCIMIQGKLAQNNKSAEEECGWGPQCPICAQSAPNLKAEDSEEEDWNGNR